jgi:mannose-6-phosphate isomerase class I
MPDDGEPYTSPTGRSVEIMICTGGSASVRDEESGNTLAIGRGDSVLVSATVRQYTIEGKAKLYKAFVP